MQEKLQKLYTSFYEKIKRYLISKHTRTIAKRDLEQKNILTKEEKKKAIEFFRPYTKIDPVFHSFYKEKTGEFNVENLPIDCYINDIDEYFNDRNASHVLDNKCLYPRLFPGIPMIEVIASRMSGFWYDGNMQMITKAQWIDIIAKEESVFVKVAVDSCGGKGVKFIEQSNMGELDKFLETL